jgi:predicted RNA-binding Zn ribbon-like protein
MVVRMKIMQPKAPGIRDISLVGGRLCLDFINTTNWHENNPVDDRLIEFSSILIWGARVGLIKLASNVIGIQEGKKAEGGVDPRVMRIKEFRYHLRKMLIGGETLDDDAVAVLNESMNPSRNQILTCENNTMVLALHETDLSWILTPLAYSAVEILISPSRERVKMCPGNGCGWLFLDMSPNNRRRWCSMAACGNKHKAKKFYRNRKRNLGN